MPRATSDDLTAELPDLLAVLSVRLGPIGRVIYSLNEWAKTPKKLATDGRSVRLDGYRLHPVNTVEVLGLNCKKIVLLVVSPRAGPDQAHAIMMTAASQARKNWKTPDRPAQTAIAQERWESTKPVSYRRRTAPRPAPRQSA